MLNCYTYTHYVLLIFTYRQFYSGMIKLFGIKLELLGLVWM